MHFCVQNASDAAAPGSGNTKAAVQIKKNLCGDRRGVTCRSSY